jgi:hypothetical protein
VHVAYLSAGPQLAQVLPFSHLSAAREVSLRRPCELIADKTHLPRRWWTRAVLDYRNGMIVCAQA